MTNKEKLFEAIYELPDIKEWKEEMVKAGYTEEEMQLTIDPCLSDQSEATLNQLVKVIL